MSGLRAAATLNRTRYATFEQLGYRADGAETMPRFAPTNSTLGLASGVVRFAYFTARRTETVTQISISTGVTAAAPAPTLIEYGLYEVAANGDLAQIGVTPNDTGLLGAATTPYAKALTAPAGLVAGARYAVAALVVTATTAPTVCGVAPLSSPEFAATARLAGVCAGQTNLLPSYTAAQIANSSNMIYASVRP